ENLRETGGTSPKPQKGNAVGVPQKDEPEPVIPELGYDILFDTSGWFEVKEIYAADNVIVCKCGSIVHMTREAFPMEKVFVGELFQPAGEVRVCPESGHIYASAMFSMSISAGPLTQSPI
ncbi:MAG: hypothetical protein LBL47_02830, partial [Lactobacillus sp.]|nr:hypothetical protein [Lactobacillus sp.]